MKPWQCQPFRRRGKVFELDGCNATSPDADRAGTLGTADTYKTVVLVTAQC
jgi:hypothetical protein